MEVVIEQTKNDNPIRCVGCGSIIPWGGKGVFCYTCPCGATLFHEADRGFIPPASLGMAIIEDRELPHIDYYLGKSNYTSKQKEEAYKYLKERGAIWSWECDECRGHTIKRTKMELEHNLYSFGIYPELMQLLENYNLRDM